MCRFSLVALIPHAIFAGDVDRCRVRRKLPGPGDEWAAVVQAGWRHYHIIRQLLRRAGS